ncbi:MAG: hypothetical protein JXO22_03850 [Phycisphaerae bacterium]|nr:hypothetical protein [Phycisphaerae bacterium]
MADKPETCAPERNTIDHDLWCIRCGYNLRTLDRDGRCPECNAAVADASALQARFHFKSRRAATRTRIGIALVALAVIVVVLAGQLISVSCAAMLLGYLPKNVARTLYCACTHSGLVSVILENTGVLVIAWPFSVPRGPRRRLAVVTSFLAVAGFLYWARPYLWAVTGFNLIPPANSIRAVFVQQSIETMFHVAVVLALVCLVLQTRNGERGLRRLLRLAILAQAVIPVSALCALCTTGWPRWGWVGWEHLLWFSEGWRYIPAAIWGVTLLALWQYERHLRRALRPHVEDAPGTLSVPHP